MESQQHIERELKKLKPYLAENYSVDRIGYFGSFSRNEQSDDSDLDIIVEFSRPIGWKFFTLEKFLEQHFNLPVDLVTRNALKERLKENILNQIKYV